MLKSNIDNNFTEHNYVKVGDLSHDITVCLIWNTRSSHYHAHNRKHHPAAFELNTSITLNVLPVQFNTIILEFECSPPYSRTQQRASSCGPIRC